MERTPPRGQVEESFMSNDHLPPLSLLQQDQHETRTLFSQTFPREDATATATASTDSRAHLPKSIFQSLTSQNQIMAMLSNFSTSYNVVSISIVLPILSTKSLYSQSVTDSSESICASALIAGMILGQILGGALGDVIGRIKALYLVMSLQILASLSSAFLVVDGAAFFGWSVFEQLAFWRLLLGIGCGGVYPLAASLSSEVVGMEEKNQVITGRRETRGDDDDDDDDDDELLRQQEEQMNAFPSSSSSFHTRTEAEQERNRLKMLAVTFSTQGIGFVSVPIVGIVSLMIFGEEHLDWVWRMILAVGSIPGVILMYLRWKEKRGRAHAMIEMTRQQQQQQQQEEEVHENLQTQTTTGEESLISQQDLVEEEEAEVVASEVQPDLKSNLWKAIQNEEDLVLKLIGTAGTWFLFDVVFYGNTLFQPVVVKTAFGYDENNGGEGGDEFTNLVRNIRDSMILSSIALPGYFVSVALIGSRICFKYIQTPRFIQIQGFAVMAGLYFIIGASWDSLIQHHWLLIFLYGSTFFFSNYGPNTTTFMLPSLTFSPDCRSTLNGMSAASGKAGALIGSIMFEPVTAKYGDSTVMSLCAGISILAGIITLYCTTPPTTSSSRTRRIVSSD